MIPQRVLVTGANGMVGRLFVERLAAIPDYDVLATARQPRFAGDASCGYAQLDLTDTHRLVDLVHEFGPQTVVNLGAMTNVDACEEQRDLCWRVNADAVGQMARACRRVGSRMVQVSTDFVFDGLDPLYADGDAPNPVNFYARSKVAAENAVRDAGHEAWCVVRPALVFGARTPSGRGNIVLWVRGELSAGRRVRVFTDQWRTPTYAPDFAEGLERVVRFGKSGVYNMSGREYLSVNAFAHQIAEAFGLDAHLIEAATADDFRQKALRPPRTGLLILKAETEVGYRPGPLADALADLRSQIDADPSLG
jgi:dTDP-4-dehydrorhamnose reductase